MSDVENWDAGKVRRDALRAVRSRPTAEKPSVYYRALLDYASEGNQIETDTLRKDVEYIESIAAETEAGMQDVSKQALEERRERARRGVAVIQKAYDALPLGEKTKFRNYLSERGASLQKAIANAGAEDWEQKRVQNNITFLQKIIAFE